MVCALAKTMQWVYAFQGSVRSKVSVAQVRGLDIPLYELLKSLISRSCLVGSRCAIFKLLVHT